MTKMQIIAKAALTFLGLSAAVNLCNNISVITSYNQDTPFLRIILFLPFLIIVFVAIVYFLILKNDWLVYKIAGPGEKLRPQNETFWLAGSLRIVAITYGLILLASSIPTILNIIISPLWILSLINEALTFKTFPKSFTLEARQWLPFICNFFEALLAAHLLYGWPQFIRYQLNIHKTKQSSNSKGTNE